MGRSVVRKAGDLYVLGLHALLREALEQWAVQRLAETAKKRMVAKLHTLKAELRLRTHEPVIAVWLDVPSALWIQSLCPKLPG